MVYWGLVVTSGRVKENPSLDRVTPLVKRILGEHGHSLVYRTIVGNDRVEILYAITSALMAGAEVVLVTGGTGPGPRDVSVDVVERVADRVLPGVGEEFRRRSLGRGVANAVMSRAGGYVFGDRLILVSPGNPDAVETMLELVLPVVGHLVEQLRGRPHRH